MKVNPARAERYRREHAERMSRLRRATGRPIAPRRTRVRLAAGYVAGTIALTAVALYPPGGDWSLLPTLILAAVLIGLGIALRRTTRLVTEAPDEVLDELQVRLRNQYYREAYTVLAPSTLLLVVISQLFPDTFTRAGGVAIMAVASAVVIGLPMVVAAFRMPDVDAGD